MLHTDNTRSGRRSDRSQSQMPSGEGASESSPQTMTASPVLIVVLVVNEVSELQSILVAFREVQFIKVGDNSPGHGGILSY